MSDSVGAVPHPAQPAATTMSPLARAGAVFVRPTHAWGGLETRAQWWIPLLVTCLIMAVVVAITYDRVVLPTQLEAMDRQVESGQMPPEAVANAEQMMTNPVVKGVSVATQAIAGFVLMGLLPALLVWLGVSFILGVRMRFRHALEVAGWSSLISLPGQLLAFTIAWFKGSLDGVHTGFGALLPESDSGVMRGLATFLDMIGPLGVWYLAVIVIGAAALSGAATKRVAWVLGGLYVAIAVLVSLVAMAR